MEQYAAILREIAEQAGVKPLKTLVKQPGIREIYRVTVYHADYRSAHVICTVTRALQKPVVLETVYHRLFNHRPIRRSLAPDAYEDFTQRIRRAGFDKLADQQITGMYGGNLCMMERAAGGFIKSVIFAPDEAEPAYVGLLEAVQAYLPEAMREVAL